MPHMFLLLSFLLAHQQEVGKNQSSHVGPFTIVAVRNGNLSPGIRFDRLRLLSLRETSLGEWTPEISSVTWLDNGASTPA